MKLLLDENLSRRLVPFLQEDFPGTSHVTLLGLSEATDREIWNYARENGFAIVTRDADFGELSALLGHPPCVIWLRMKTPNQSKAAVLNLLCSQKQEIERVVVMEGMSCIELNRDGR